MALDMKGRKEQGDKQRDNFRDKFDNNTGSIFASFELDREARQG